MSTFKCAICNKKLIIFNCMCGNSFCLKHINYDSHNCLKYSEFIEKEKLKLKEKLYNGIPEKEKVIKI